MLEKNVLVGRDRELKLLLDFYHGARKNGRGVMVAFEAESGFGKTLLAERFLEHVRDERDNTLTAEAHCQAPVGDMRVGEIQPLFPFRKILETLSAKTEGAARKKLLMNMGMTVLSVIPIIGDVFYGIKEFRRDIREYQKDSSEGKEVKSRDGKRLIQQFAEGLRKIAADNFLVLFLDDFQWADAQSVQLLDQLARNIGDIQAMIIVSYRASETAGSLHTVTNVVADAKNKGRIGAHMKLRVFDEDNIRTMLEALAPELKNYDQLVEWLLERSAGVPGVLAEYIRYFNTNSPVDEEGRLSDHLHDEAFIPTTVNALFASTLERLSEEDRTLLSLCAVEGRECTVYVVARLLNTDVLTAVRRMRSVQRRTGIIRSIGARMQYGRKTTVYEFTQALYHGLFVRSLEHEEKTTIHAQIAEILRQDLDAARTEEEREQIVPYLAAHSDGAGDDRQLRTMLLESAQLTDKYNSEDVTRSLFANFLEHEPLTADERDVFELQAFASLLGRRGIESNGSITEELNNLPEADAATQWATERQEIIAKFLRGDFRGASYLLDRFRSRFPGDDLAADVVLELEALRARCLTELHDYDQAEVCALGAIAAAEAHNQPVWRCLALNALAVLYRRQGRRGKAEEVLRQVGELSLTLGREIQLVTSANLAAFLHSSEPAKSDEYRRAALKLAGEMELHSLGRDLSAR